ncbi:hypothetical protein AGMMS49992_33470 [Clostridia bacterium]|nr:hypothetical protein AGMMS49992_33470 [Clostridia bacterium]
MRRDQIRVLFEIVRSWYPNQSDRAIVHTLQLLSCDAFRCLNYKFDLSESVEIDGTVIEEDV